MELRERERERESGRERMMYTSGGIDLEYSPGWYAHLRHCLENEKRLYGGRKCTHAALDPGKGMV